MSILYLESWITSSFFSLPSLSRNYFRIFQSGFPLSTYQLNVVSYSCRILSNINFEGQSYKTLPAGGNKTLWSKGWLAGHSWLLHFRSPSGSGNTWNLEGSTIINLYIHYLDFFYFNLFTFFILTLINKMSNHNHRPPPSMSDKTKQLYARLNRQTERPLYEGVKTLKLPVHHLKDPE